MELNRKWGILGLWLVLTAVSSAQNPPSLKLGDAPEKSTESQATAIIYNEADPESADLAQYYAERRQVPKDQIIGLRCSTNEEITRAEYESTVAEPLRREFRSRGWWETQVTTSGTERVTANKIRFVALMRGVPLKVARVQGYTPDSRGKPMIVERNEASVDTEIAALAPAPTPISGVAPNPYFRSYARFLDAPIPQMMLVCRLDGPSSQVVKRMINDSLRAEKEGLWGICYIDIRGLRNGDYTAGDTALKKAAVDVQRSGVPVIMDAGEKLFPPGYPMRHASLYYGWYAEHPGGAFTEPGNIFVPGAIAFHIHSFSAETVRSPDRRWVGPLLNRGAAAAFGSVYEPFLGLLTTVEIVQDRLRRGYTLAESAYAGQVGLSWMNTCVGDPLYKPFRLVNDVLETPPETEWTAYANGVNVWFNEGREKGEAALRDAGNRLKSGVIFEGLGLLLAGARDLPASYSSFGRARRLYNRNADDVLRCYLHEINLLRFNGKPKEALAMVREAIKAYPDSNTVNLLRTIELELDPPPSPTTGASATPAATKTPVPTP